MRNRGYDHYSGPSHSTVEIGQTHVTVRESKGTVRVAVILEKTADVKGRVTGVLLDRVVHEEHGRYRDSAGNELEAWGCFATEFKLKGEPRDEDPPEAD